jgi:uncharacterized protein (TIGR02246 family)
MAAREATEDAVERQVRAYNEGDLEEFIACYAEDVVFEDGDGIALMSGREEIRERYGRLFARAPSLHGEIVTRIRVGSYVVDEERITGRPDGELHTVAIYRLDATA